LEFRNRLVRAVVTPGQKRQEPEGCWFDYPLYSYHKPYGTAFALLALGACRKGQ
jgi:hypothetical protein